MNEVGHYSLWESVGNKCLQLAKQALEKETAPTKETVETVERLVKIAISIDELNLHWVKQNQFDEAASWGRLS